MTTEHTPEPWRVSVDGEAVVIPCGNGEATVADCFDADREGFPATRKANARRIIACVNYCKGKTNAQLEDGDEGYPGIAHDFETMRLQRDALAEALRHLIDCVEFAGMLPDAPALINARAALAKLS
jgi:hypothetical protein